MPALDAIEVEGYKSIRAAKIELGAINVLIGATARASRTCSACSGCSPI
jgi:hypothetical protein